jgi:hypothetical protein
MLLNLNDFDAERNFQPEAIGQRFHRHLACAVDAEERERHASKDRSDVDDQTIALLAHGGENGAGNAQETNDVGVEYGLRMIGRESLGHAGRRVPALLMSTSIFSAWARTFLTQASTEASSSTSNSTVLTPRFCRAPAASRFLPFKPIEA